MYLNTSLKYWHFNKNKYLIITLFYFFLILISNLIVFATVVGDFDYGLDTSSYIATVNGYSGSNTNVVIPSAVTVDGQDYAVNKISQTAFFNNTNITTVKGESITKIEDMTTSGNDGAFRGCTSLQSIDFENLIYLGTHAFDNCKSLQDINLPNVTYIGGYAFNKCNSNSLVSVSLPEALYLGENAFFDSSIQTLRVPKMTYMHKKAFHNCKKLTNLYAPSLVYFSMGNNDIFDGVTSDVDFYVSEIVKRFNYPSNPSNIFQSVDFNNLSTDITVKNIDTFEQIDSKIGEIKTEISTKYGVSESAIKFDVLGNCLVKSGWLPGEYNYAYAVKFSPNDYDMGISSGFTDIVYLISIDKFAVKFEGFDFTYTGSSQMPTVTINNGETTLTEGTDYDISCSDPINAGDKLLNITLKGNYQRVGNTNDSGNSCSFVINKADIPNFDINVNGFNTFTGNPIQLISSISDNSIFTGDTGVNLWLRIADGFDELPNNDKPWVKFVNESTLNDSHLKRTNVGTYYVYYYVDGGSNYNDVTTSSSSSSSTWIEGP